MMSRVLDICILILLIACTVFYAARGEKSRPCESWVGRVVSVQGSIESKRHHQVEWQPVPLDTRYCPGDMIRALEGGEATIILKDHSYFQLTPWTTITFSTRTRAKTTWFHYFLNRFIRFMQCTPLQHNRETLFINAAFLGSVRSRWRETSPGWYS